MIYPNFGASTIGQLWRLAGSGIWWGWLRSPPTVPVDMRLAPIFAFAFSSTAAMAATVDTPQCRTDLARASRLIDEIDARRDSVKGGDTAGLCALLRRNRTDMTEATRIMDRCLTGHEHRENVGQMAASLGDINAVLARRCK